MTELLVLLVCVVVFECVFYNVAGRLVYWFVTVHYVCSYQETQTG